MQIKRNATNTTNENHDKYKSRGIPPKKRNSQQHIIDKDQDQGQFELSNLRNGVFTFIESYISFFITISQRMMYRNL